MSQRSSEKSTAPVDSARLREYVVFPEHGSPEIKCSVAKLRATYRSAEERATLRVYRGRARRRGRRGDPGAVRGRASRASSSSESRAGSTATPRDVPSARRIGGG